MRGALPGAQQVSCIHRLYLLMAKNIQKIHLLLVPLYINRTKPSHLFFKKSPMRSNRLHGQLYTVKREELKMHLDARGRKQISNQWFFEMCFDLNYSLDYSQSFLQASTIFHFSSMCFAFLVNFKRFKGAQVKS